MIVFYCRLTAASVVLSVSEAFMCALLNVKKIYAFPAAGLSLFNIVSITAILILHQSISVGAVAVGLVGGMIAQNLYLMVRLIPSRPLRFFKASIVDKETPLFLSVASTLILIELINRSYFMIDRYFAPRLGEGIVSALNYGQVLALLPESIVGFAVILLVTKFAASALLPRWFGYVGISAATSISHVGFGLGLMGYIVAKWSALNRNRFISTLVRLFLAGFVVYLAAYVFRRVTWPLVEDASHIVMYLALAASALIVFGSYVGMVALLGFKRYFTDALPWRRSSRTPAD